METLNANIVFAFFELRFGADSLFPFVLLDNLMARSGGVYNGHSRRHKGTSSEGARFSAS
jgi:hypothetical protein